MQYNTFLKTFGDEGNLIVLGVKDSSLFTIEKLNAWNRLSSDFKVYNEVETVVPISDLQKLIKNETKTIRSAIYLDKAIVNTSERKDFITDILIPKKEPNFRIIPEEDKNKSN